MEKVKWIEKKKTWGGGGEKYATQTTIPEKQEALMHKPWGGCGLCP